MIVTGCFLILFLIARIGRERSGPRAKARYREISRGDTSLRLTSPPSSPSNPAISIRVTARPCRMVAQQPVPCARVQPCLAPSSQLWRECDVNEVGINLLWWRREEEEEEEEFPCVSAETSLCIPAERTGRLRPQPSPTSTCLNSQLGGKKSFLHFVSPNRRFVCGMIHVSNENFVKRLRRWFISVWGRNGTP